MTVPCIQHAHQEPALHQRRSVTADDCNAGDEQISSVEQALAVLAASKRSKKSKKEKKHKKEKHSKHKYKHKG